MPLSAAGRLKEKVLPLPTWLSTYILPPCASASLRVTYRPSPRPSWVPWPGNLRH